MLPLKQNISKNSGMKRARLMQGKYMRKQSVIAFFIIIKWLLNFFTLQFDSYQKLASKTVRTPESTSSAVTNLAGTSSNTAKEPTIANTSKHYGVSRPCLAAENRIEREKAVTNNRQELLSYLADPLVELKDNVDDFDIIKWWKVCICIGIFVQSFTCSISSMNHGTQS